MSKRRPLNSTPRAEKTVARAQEPIEVRPAPTKKQKVFLVVTVVLLVLWLAILAWMAII